MPSAVRPRSASPANADRAVKKAKPDASQPIQLPESSVTAGIRDGYEKATPYKHTVVPGLLSDELVSVIWSNGC